MGRSNPFDAQRAGKGDGTKPSPFAAPAAADPGTGPESGAEELTPPRAIEAVPSSLWVIAACLLLLLLLGLSGYSLWQQKLANDAKAQGDQPKA